MVGGMILESKINHFYVFRVTEEGHNIYERTCGEETAASDRVAELKKHHLDAFFTKNELPKKYYY